LGGRPAGTVLGRLGVPIVILELRHAGTPPREAGLYHTAIVFPTRADLRRVFAVARAHPRSFTGSADHLVSEAFYFDDPEGNGLELYWDRPRSTWTWHDGSLELRADPLDPNAFLNENIDLDAIDSTDDRSAQVGHVHLSIGDIPTARDFYVDKLGFELTIPHPAAIFVSAGGYHHHMAMNVFQSRGAGPRQLTLGLGRVRITVPTPDDVAALAERLGHFSIPTAHDGASLRFRDPWLNEIQVRPIETGR
jgi:catechol 2,3-dioxygenase